MTSSTPAKPKVNWATVAADAVTIGVAVEGILSVAGTAAKSLSLPAGDVATLAGISTAVGVIVSTLKQLLASPIAKAKGALSHPKQSTP